MNRMCMDSSIELYLKLYYGIWSFWNVYPKGKNICLFSISLYLWIKTIIYGEIIKMAYSDFRVAFLTNKVLIENPFHPTINLDLIGSLKLSTCFYITSVDFCYFLEWKSVWVLLQIHNFLNMMLKYKMFLKFLNFFPQASRQENWINMGKLIVCFENPSISL